MTDRRRFRAGIVTALALMMLASMQPTSALGGASELPPGGTFVDDDGIVAEGALEALTTTGIIRGCNPPANDRICPDRPLTRAEMATVFVRALSLEPSTLDWFTDDEPSVHETAINALAAAGITRGCNPPANDRFCPERRITRGEMAAFIVRAFGFGDAGASDYFADDSDSVFEDDINRIAAAGVASGCAPEEFCAQRVLTRGEMAQFIARALGLPIVVPPARPFPAVGDGKRIIYSNSDQRVWLVDEDEQLVDTYLVSGRKGVPSAGTYRVFSKSLHTRSLYGGITMGHMVRFAYGKTAAIGFHGIPRYADGTPMQTEDELGQYRSAGCVRQADDKARFLYSWAPIGTTVIVLP